MDIRRIYATIERDLVGRRTEAQLILAALGAGRDVLLEGPPGTTKSTLLRAICAAAGVPFYFVEGHADLTPAKILGHHSPVRVLQEGYTPEGFIYGPLPLAMRDGGIFYIEEFNRVPEDTLNTLLTAMAERELSIPRLGVVRAAPGFRLVAAMNPFDNIGTNRLSGAVADRLCRVHLDYQSPEEEREIVARRTGTPGGWLVDVAVEVVQRTRRHPDLRMGASVRGAIDFVLVAGQLAGLRDERISPARDDVASRQLLVAAARTALAVKVAVRESSRRSADSIVEEIVLAVLDGRPETPSYPEPGSPGRRPADRESPTHPGTGHGGGTGRAMSRPPDQLAATSHVGATGSGRVYLGDEALDAAARRPASQRVVRAFAERHPHVTRALRRVPGARTALEISLADGPPLPSEILGEIQHLAGHADHRALVDRLARDVVVRMAQRDVDQHPGPGRLTSVPYRGEAAELDLDRSLERVLERPEVTDEDLLVIDRRPRKRAYALMLDVSGSMRGAAIYEAALALAAVAVRVDPDPFAVVAFWRDAAVLKRLDEPVDLDHLIDRVLSLPGRGLTNLALGLRVGLDELSRASTQERVGLLFSDGLRTAGPPPDAYAAAFPTLHVIATGRSEESATACRELAALGDGRCSAITGLASIPAAISACLYG